MGLFRRKKKSNDILVAVGSSDSDSFNEPTTKKNGSKRNKKKKKKTSATKKQQQQNATLSLTSSNDQDEISSVDLGDIPRSISTTTQSSPDLPPPVPTTPNPEDGRNDEDSIGSPCEAMMRLNDKCEDEGRCDSNNNRKNNTGRKTEGAEGTLTKSPASPLNLSTKKLLAKLSSQPTPSIQLLPDYIAALTEVHSKETAGDLPSRALRALFSLSEHAKSHEVRVAMVRDGVVSKNRPNKKSAGALIPTLLAFLRRCPKDSSEQYLALLVLNNLSIPVENKCLVGVECGAANVLGRMLLEDVGCHLLVIVVVNLTFCDVDVRRRLLLGDVSGSGAEDGEVHLIDCLAYALMLSSITTEQLSTLGPIPLHSPNGKPHTPHQLLSILRSTLATTFPNFIHNSDDHDNISPPLLLSDNEKCPFPETARWCLCALKNLTRPGKLSPSSRSVDNEDKLSGDAIAARAIIDAGLVPILLRVIRVAKKADATDMNTSLRSDLFVGRLPDEICNEGHVVSPNMINMPTWNSNSAQDAGLYTLMHMTSIPSVSDDLLRKNSSVGGGSLIVDELKNIVHCGLEGVGVGDRLLDVVTGDGLVADFDREDGVAMAVEGAELGWLALQCMKARMSLSFLLNNGTSLIEKYNCSSCILIAGHDAHSLVELLSHCLESRSKEGPGGYSGATFTLKGVVHSIRCLLSMESGNRTKFASINGARLNSLLLKVVARYALLSDEGDNNNSGDDAIDNEAVDDAVVSLYYMSQVGFHESVCMSSHGQSTFLPSTFGKNSSSAKSRGAKDIIVKVLTLYIGNTNASPSNIGRHAAIQLMLRASLLRFEGEVADLTYLGKRYPSRMDFDFDDELLAAADSLLIEKQTEGAKPKPILFGRRQIARYERYGSNKPTVFSNPIIAAEDIALKTVSHSEGTVDDIAIANDIASAAEGLLPGGESHSFIWEWEDCVRVSIDEVQSQGERSTSRQSFASVDKKSTSGSKDGSSTAPKQRGLLGKLGNLVSVRDDEPVSIFGFRCAAPKCGRNTAL